jgi:hypothetical protein
MHCVEIEIFADLTWRNRGDEFRKAANHTKGQPGVERARVDQYNALNLTAQTLQLVS